LNNYDHNPAHTRQGIIFIIIGLALASLAGAVMKLLSDECGPEAGSPRHAGNSGH
jgi:hypothetical protein